MTTIQIETTYWNNKGAEQDKYNEMERAGWLDCMTKDSDAKMYSYYRYYNDGDMPGWARSRWDLKVWDSFYQQYVLNRKGQQELEDRATAVVLSEYKRFKKAQERGEI